MAIPTLFLWHSSKYYGVFILIGIISTILSGMGLFDLINKDPSIGGESKGGAGIFGAFASLFLGIGMFIGIITLIIGGILGGLISHGILKLLTPETLKRLNASA